MKMAEGASRKNPGAGMLRARSPSWSRPGSGSWSLSFGSWLVVESDERTGGRAGGHPTRPGSARCHPLHVPRQPPDDATDPARHHASTRVLCAAQGQGDRGQGRASTPADRRSLDAVDDAPEGAKVRPGSPGDLSRTSVRCCPLLPPLPSLPTTPSWPPPCSAAPPVGRQKTLVPPRDLIDPPCRLWAVFEPRPLDILPCAE